MTATSMATTSMTTTSMTSDIKASRFASMSSFSPHHLIPPALQSASLSHPTSPARVPFLSRMIRRPSTPKISVYCVKRDNKFYLELAQNEPSNWAKCTTESNIMRPKADESGHKIAGEQISVCDRSEKTIDFLPLALSSFAHANAGINLLVAPSKETLVDAHANVNDVLSNERHSVNDQVSLQKPTERIASRALCGSFVGIRVLSTKSLAKVSRGATRFLPQRITSARTKPLPVTSASIIRTSLSSIPGMNAKPGKAYSLNRSPLLSLATFD